MRHRFTIPAALAVLCVAGIIIPNAARAQTDHRNLEQGLPITIEDAYPTPYLNREFQLVTRYDRVNGRDLTLLNPRFEYGFARNWQGRIEAPFRLGSADRTGSGDTALEAFYNFNAESLTLPAFAASVRAIFPSGERSRGVDTEYKLLFTKTPGQAKNFDRLHLNLQYLVNAQADEMERNGRFTGAAGYSRRLGPNYILVTDYVYQQEREKSKDSHVIEAGVRFQHSPLTIFTFGAGAGLTKNSPDFRVSLGFQRAITFF